jgi:Flp pilus assembly protein TadG
MKQRLHSKARFRRRAAALVEFSLIALVTTLLLATVIEMGRALHGAQVEQQTADVAARELARTPLPANFTLQQALADPGVKQKLYNPDDLIVNLDQLRTANIPIDTYFASLPLVNQQLRSLMVFDRVNGTNVLRYPGGIVADATTTSGFRHTGIYLVTYDSAGTEMIDPNPLPVLQEIGYDYVSQDPNTSSFNLTATGPNTQPGYVMLRVNYPFQAAMLSNYYRDPARPLEPGGKVILASDPEDPAALLASGQLPLYSGAEGLGQQYALRQTVRPFRKVLSGVAVYRRELFTSPVP